MASTTDRQIKNGYVAEFNNCVVAEKIVQQILTSLRDKAEGRRPVLVALCVGYDQVGVIAKAMGITAINVDIASVIDTGKDLRYPAMVADLNKVPLNQVILRALKLVDVRPGEAEVLLAVHTPYKSLSSMDAVNKVRGSPGHRHAGTMKPLDPPNGNFAMTCDFLANTLAN